jgi:hypothetical protein
MRALDERLQAAFARETAAMCASLLGIAGIETKLEQLLAEPSAGKLGAVQLPILAHVQRN